MLGDNELPYVETEKFLGLVWDIKLSWKPHIAKVRGECTKLLGILRMITGQKWGADQSSLLKVYRAFIRAKLGYGAVVYGSASKSALNSLNGAVTEALRICTGSFKTTPIARLHILTNEKDPQHRREYLSLRYYYKIKSCISKGSFTPRAAQCVLGIHTQAEQRLRLTNIYLR